MSEQKRSIEDRLKGRADLLKRFESIINIVEDSGGEINTADDVEERVTRELRKLGNEVIHDWGKEKESEIISKGMRGHGKKKLNGIRRMAR